MIRDVIDPFVEGCGLVVGKRNRGYLPFEGHFNRFLGRKHVVIFHLLERSLGEMPVLAEPASEVAPRSAETEYVGARKHMILGLFFNGVKLYGGGFGVDDAVQNAIFILPVPAIAPLAFIDDALPEADFTLHPAVRELSIVHRLFHILERFDLFHVGGVCFRLFSRPLFFRGFGRGLTGTGKQKGEEGYAVQELHSHPCSAVKKLPSAKFLGLRFHGKSLFL